MVEGKFINGIWIFKIYEFSNKNIWKFFNLISSVYIRIMLRGDTLMDINKLQMIQIHWEGPYNLDDLPNLMNTESDYGVYQIYGNHPLYGKDVLLYIGQADQQTFGKRISQENWTVMNDAINIKIYVGRLFSDKIHSSEKWSKEINLAESLLIYVHTPAHNARSIYRIQDTELQNVYILNVGNYRDIFPEVSGLRWTSRLDNIKFKMYKWG